MSDNGANFIKAISNLEDLGRKDYDQLLRKLEIQKYGSQLPASAIMPEDDSDMTEEEVIQFETNFYQRLLLSSYHDGVLEVDIRAISGGENGTKWNTCVSHSIQVLLRDVLKKFPLLHAIMVRMGDIVAFVINRSEVRRKLKAKCKKTVLVPCPTRWSYVVRMAERLLEVINFIITRH